MSYSNACMPAAAEMPPRSPHHAAMLVLEDRVAKLSSLIDSLQAALQPALRPHEPQTICGGGLNDPSAKNPSSSAQLIAHVEDVSSVIDSCIQRIASVADRLVI